MNDFDYVKTVWNICTYNKYETSVSSLIHCKTLKSNSILTHTFVLISFVLFDEKIYPLLRKNIFFLS